MTLAGVSIILSVNCLASRMFLMPANGPAIKGGCGTWRSQPATCPGSLGRELSRWQARYGACFCSQGTEVCEHYVCRGTMLLDDPESVTVLLVC